MAQLVLDLESLSGGVSLPTSTTITKVVFSSSSVTHTISSACKSVTVAFTSSDNNYMSYFRLGGKSADIYQDNSSNGGTATWFNVPANSVLSITGSSFTVHVITME